MEREQLLALASPTRLDLAIARFFPRWAASRLRNRREFSYEAARSSRLRNSSRILQGPEDFTAFPDRLQLIRQVRDLEQNFGLFQAIIDKLALYGFGRIKYQAATGDPAVDQQYEDHLAGWFDTCDISGRHDFQSLVSIAFKSQLRDGDMVEMWRRDAGTLKLQGIESDRIGGNIIVNTPENYFQGISVDLDTGAPLTYDVYRRTKANVYTDKVPVPAGDVLLLFDPRRIDQYRGITPFAPIVNEARDLKEVLEACLQGTKFENYHAAIGYTPTGSPIDDPQSLITSTTTVDANGVPVKEQQLKPGMIQWAPSDAEYEFMKSDRPSGTFQTYVDLLIRLEAIALNLPFSFVYSMMGLPGPAVRADLQQAGRVIEWHQANTAKRLMTPAKNMALIDGIARGDIPYTKRWNRGRWQFAPAVSIDAGRDSAARVQERNAGLRSKESIFTEDGDDAMEQERMIADETRRTIATAKKIAQEEQVPLDIVMTLLEVRTPNGFLAIRDQTTAATPDGVEAPSDQQDSPPETDGNLSNDLSKREVVRELIKVARQRRAQYDQRLNQLQRRRARS